MKKLIIVTGASGVGKTSILRLLDERKIPNLKIYFFDDLGVPSTEEMIRDFGSVENWQKDRLSEWIEKIIKENTKDEIVILDGSVRPGFVPSGYEIVLFDCADEVREKRLIERGHPELANDDMRNWAKYLREDCKKEGHVVIDTTNQTLDESGDALLIIFNEKT